MGQEEVKGGTDVLSVKQLSDWLGWSIFRIYNYVEQGKIPYLRADPDNCRSKIYFLRGSIDEWLKGREFRPKSML